MILFLQESPEMVTFPKGSRRDKLYPCPALFDTLKTSICKKMLINATRVDRDFGEGEAL